jgi:hypothetical protein
MAFSRNLNTYFDIQDVLTAARQSGGGTYELDTYGAAIRWRARAYFYRTLLRNEDHAAAGNVPSYRPTTEWDDLRLTITDNTVFIEWCAGALAQVRPAAGR